MEALYNQERGKGGPLINCFACSMCLYYRTARPSTDLMNWGGHHFQNWRFVVRPSSQVENACIQHRNLCQILWGFSELVWDNWNYYSFTSPIQLTSPFAVLPHVTLAVKDNPSTDLALHPLPLKTLICWPHIMSRGHFVCCTGRAWTALFFKMEFCNSCFEIPFL